MTKDMDELDELIKKNPDWPIWRALAQLGWVPPATAAGFRKRIHDLEGPTKLAGELVVGDRLPATKELIAVGRLNKKIFATLEDGTNVSWDDHLEIVRLA
jgi:hypothetical protein